MNPYLQFEHVGNDRVCLINGRLAGAGDADATGMLLSDDKMAGSAVLISRDAILTTHHILRDDFADYYFFLPGVGKRTLKSCLMSLSEPAGPCHGCIEDAPDGVPKDLAILFLEESIDSIEPVELASTSWKANEKKMARVSGFGKNSLEGYSLTGLRQYFDASVELNGDQIRFLSGDSKLAAGDSGGPIILGGTNRLIGLSVQEELSGEPSRGIRLSKESIVWIKNSILLTSRRWKSRRRRRGDILTIAVSRGDRANPIDSTADFINVRRLDDGEQLVVTAIAQKRFGRPIRIALSVNGSSENSHTAQGYRCQLELNGPTETDLSIAYSAPEGDALGQIVYTIHSTETPNA